VLLGREDAGEWVGLLLFELPQWLDFVYSGTRRRVRWHNVRPISTDAPIDCYRLPENLRAKVGKLVKSTMYVSGNGLP